MFERCFSPITIAGVQIPNRITRTAHATMLAFNQPVSDDLIAYHLERAKGGVGLTILEAASVHRSSALALTNRDDSVIPHYEKLVRAIAPTGMRLFQQLWHGGHIYPDADGGPPWAPSAIVARYATVPPVVMTPGQIGELVEAFAAAARRVHLGGLDGVEIHVGHGYLFSQFLSPVLNRREDDYGGTEENRLRFLIGTLRAVRAATSPDFAIGMRISESGDPRIFSIDQANKVCRRVEADGLIDYVNISHSDYYDNAETIAGMDRPSGYQLPTSRRIGEGLSIPRLVVGRFGTLDDVEQVLREGGAELVNMVRAHIADPMLVQKSREGRSAEVRPCIACNQGCIGGAVSRGRMGCVVNPAAGTFPFRNPHRADGRGTKGSHRGRRSGRHGGGADCRCDRARGDAGRGHAGPGRAAPSRTPHAEAAGRWRYRQLARARDLPARRPGQAVDLSRCGGCPGPVSRRCDRRDRDGIS
jgi:2,4-dienoyl-CoA reductase-like NADH-dependent reductase (Old Yellow Enzyme family)